MQPHSRGRRHRTRVAALCARTFDARPQSAEKKRLLGEKFVLKNFHDEFMSKGQIPIALIRHEMTGYDKDVKKFWEHEPLAVR